MHSLKNKQYKTVKISANDLGMYNAYKKAGYYTVWVGNNNLCMGIDSKPTFEQELTLFKELGTFDAMREITYTTKAQAKQVVKYIDALLKEYSMQYNDFVGKVIAQYVIQGGARQTLLDEQTRLFDLYSTLPE